MRGDDGMFDLQKLGAVLLEQETKHTPNKNVPMYRRKVSVENIGSEKKWGSIIGDPSER